MSSLSLVLCRHHFSSSRFSIFFQSNDSHLLILENSQSFLLWIWTVSSLILLFLIPTSHILDMFILLTLNMSFMFPYLCFFKSIFKFINSLFSYLIYLSHSMFFNFRYYILNFKKVYSFQISLVLFDSILSLLMFFFCFVLF